jgi:hypothetical protein
LETCPLSCSCIPFDVLPREFSVKPFHVYLVIVDLEWTKTKNKEGDIIVFIFMVLWLWILTSSIFLSYIFCLIDSIVETILIGNFPRWFNQHRACTPTWSYTYIWGKVTSIIILWLLYRSLDKIKAHKDELLLVSCMPFLFCVAILYNSSVYNFNLKPYLTINSFLLPTDVFTW